MTGLRLIGPIAVTLGAISVSPAAAGQGLYGGDGRGLEVAYDDAEWEATKLTSLPYFTCIAPDCDNASCMVIRSLSPDFAVWPETVDEASLAALDDIFLDYEKSGGHDEAEIVQPTGASTIGGRETLVSVIARKTADTRFLSSKYMLRDGGDTRMVTCEGDEKSITASKARIEALIGAIKFTPR